MKHGMTWEDAFDPSSAWADSGERLRPGRLEAHEVEMAQAVMEYADEAHRCGVFSPEAESLLAKSTGGTRRKLEQTRLVIARIQQEAKA